MSHWLYCERPCKVDTIYRGGDKPARRFDVRIATTVSSSGRKEDDAVGRRVMVAMPVEEAEALINDLRKAVREARVSASRA